MNWSRREWRQTANRDRHMALSKTQRGVLRGILISLPITVLVLGGAMIFGPRFFTPVNDLAARIGFGLAWTLVPAAWLMVAIGTQARHRFFTPADIDGSGLTSGTADAKLHQAILQNTLEQTALAEVAYGATAVLVSSHLLAVIPAAAILFSIGRLLFWAGYGQGAAGRALGFCLTFYPTVALFAIAAISALSAAE